MPEQQRPPERCRLHITGIVQGIGFRPFLYRLATRHSLVGFVRNDDRGVELEVEGEAAAVTAFVAALRPEAPPLARITAVEASVVPALGRETAFAIEHSLATGEARANYRLIGGGEGVHWPDLDEDISVHGMLHGVPAPPPRQTA